MAQNTALLNIAGVLESLRTAIVNGEGVPYDKQEVLVLCLQATIQILCGGSPSITLPTIGAPAGINDAAIARFCRNTISATPFVPGGPNFTTQTGVLADGTQTPITFLNAFPNSCIGVLCTPSNYSGSDNAVLIPNVVGNPTKTGFTVTVGGGQSGSTCTLTYFPIGT